jgi:NAD(P)-dependent dehydrogenase (short-subunit alcohol dehydrogenase family)
MNLDGTVAIVTGAGRGIGREHALLLAASGAAVVVNDLGGGPDGAGAAGGPAREVAEEITAAGSRAVADGSDVADPAGAQAVIDTALTAFGRLDTLVNNAGILRDRVLVNMSDEDWDIVVRVNLRGTFLMTRAAARHWRAEHKHGRPPRASVVNTSSESGVFANPGQVNYAAAKSGVATLTQVAAKELGRYGVRVNAILPRARTRLTTGTFGDALDRADDGTFDKWHPGNISPFVVCLAAPDCEITGEVFVVGGSRVQRIRPWSADPGWKLQTDGRWTPDELAEAISEAGLPGAPARSGNPA